jgi:hypothetical protein
MRLVNEAEASNFSAFRLEKPVDDVTPEVPASKQKGAKEQKDPEVEGRLLDVRKVFGDDWDGRTVKLASGAEPDYVLHSSEGTIRASNTGSSMWTVRDAGRGYIVLEDDEGAVMTFGDDKRAAATAESDLSAAALELVLLEGADGFCLAPMSVPGHVMEVMMTEDAPYPLGLVPEEEISTFSEVVVVDG